ncbi:hypothetical protein COBT_000927 [Conglomerata obtusa]
MYKEKILVSNECYIIKSGNRESSPGWVLEKINNQLEFVDNLSNKNDVSMIKNEIKFKLYYISNKKKINYEIIKKIETKFYTEVITYDKIDNIAKILPSGYNYIETCNKKHGLYMIYKLNGFKIKEVKKTKCSNFNVYVYVKNNESFLWRGEYSSDEEYIFAKAFIKNLRIENTICNKEIFFKLINCKLPDKFILAKKHSCINQNIFSYDGKSIKQFDFNNRIDRKIIKNNFGYIIDFRDFIVVFRTGEIKKENLIYIVKLFIKTIKLNVNIFRKDVFYIANVKNSFIMDYFDRLDRNFCDFFYKKKCKIYNLNF